MTPTVTQSQIQTVLRTFLLSILPAGVECIEGQDNRVPEPQGSDFVVMTAIRRERIETNVDTYNDCMFVGSISGTVLTVTSVSYGSVTVGNTVFGENVTNGTTIISSGDDFNSDESSDFGPWIYTVSPSQTVASETMAAGVQSILQPTRITYQLDVHGPNSANNAQAISTLFRDQYAAASFEASGYPISPLYADDPKQMPFINAEEQYETRWVVEAVLQANMAIIVPQQFADVLTPKSIDVANEYPVN